VGETVADLEDFHPDRMAGRILGMGDVLSLVERAEQSIATEDAGAMERRLLEADFNLADFLDQLRMIKRMGPLNKLVGMLPNMPPGLSGGKISEDDIDENALVRTEAIIQSMTPGERTKPQLINASRRQRIAKGSGTKPQDVASLLKQFDMMRKMLKQQLGRVPGLGSRSGRKARKALPKMKGF
jgi:signal recognition particle subunit SRP54